MPSTIRWIGNAPKISQVRAYVIDGTWENTDKIRMTIGTKTVTLVSGSTNTTTIAALMVTTWNALSATVYPEFAELTASNVTNAFSLTSDTPGKPFNVTISSVETNDAASDGQTIDSVASPTTSTGTDTTANSGPNDAACLANYSGGVLPVDGDTLIFDSGNVDVLYNLDQNAISLAALTILPGYTGKIGLPMINVDATAYYEYRQQYLCFGNSGDAQACVTTINGGGGRIQISHGTAQATFFVNKKTQRIDQNVPQVLLKCTHASTALHLTQADVGVAFYGGETSTLLTLNSAFQSNPAGDVALYLGSGVTLTAPTITQTGGVVNVNSAITSTSVVNLSGGVYYQNGTGGIAAGLTVGGTAICVYNSSGTIGGAPILSGKGTLDFSQDLRSKAVTNPIDIFGTATILDPNKVTGAIVVDLDQITNGDRLGLGTNLRLTRGAVA